MSFFLVPVLGHSVTHTFTEDFSVALMPEAFAVITAGAINAHLRFLHSALAGILSGTALEGGESVCLLWKLPFSGIVTCIKHSGGDCPC